MSSSSDAARNRELWTRTNAKLTDDWARRAWASDEITWGTWGVKERDIHELLAPPDAKTPEFYDYVSADWATKWPSEEIWKARKR